MKGSVPVTIYILVAILAISAMLMSLGQRDTTARPSGESDGPSGVSALVRLLRQNGAKVVLDPVLKPSVAADDVVVLFMIHGRFDTFYDESIAPLREHVDAFVRRGGTAVYLPVERDFQEASVRAQEFGPTTIVRSTDGRQAKVTYGGGIDPEESIEQIRGAQPANRLYSLDGEIFALAARHGKGTKIGFQDGIMGTNRFIAEHDNAETLVSTLLAAKPSQGRIVFAEAAAGNSRSRGLLEIIGPWAQAAWGQILFLFVVVVFTLGKRFGIPEEVRPRQTGSRELVDAIAGSYRRMRAGSVALQAGLESARARLRRSLKIPSEAAEGELERLLPDSVREVLAKAERLATHPEVSDRAALERMQEVEREIESFLASTRGIPTK